MARPLRLRFGREGLERLIVAGELLGGRHVVLVVLVVLLRVELQQPHERELISMCIRLASA